MEVGRFNYCCAMLTMTCFCGSDAWIVSFKLDVMTHYLK